MIESFVASVFGSLAVKYLPRFVRRPKAREIQPVDPPQAETSHAQAELLKSVTRFPTGHTMAALFLRSAVNSTDGEIRLAGRIVRSGDGPRPIGPVLLQIGDESIRSDTAARAIQIVSAVDLLYGMGYIARHRHSRDSVLYRITAAGVAKDSETTFIQSERPDDAIPRR